MSRAVVLGATGHLGNAVVRELVARDYRVTAASRRPRPPANLDSLDVTFLPGDGDTSGQLERWIEGHDVVVDAAAPYPLHPFRIGSQAAAPEPLEYAEWRTRALLRLISRHEARLAYISSFTTLPRARSVWGHLQGRLARRLHPYFETKDRIEELILEAANDGLPAVVVNPTSCLGPWDVKRRELCFIPQLLAGEVPVSVEHVLNVIDVRDVAAGLVSMLEAERYGEPTLLSGHNINLDSLTTWICEVGGVERPKWRAAAELTFLPVLATEALLPFADRPVPAPLLATMLLLEQEWMTPSQAQRDLGVDLHPLSATIRDAVAWYRRLGYC